MQAVVLFCYHNEMKYILVTVVLSLATNAEAYNPVMITADEPYAEIVIPMDAENQQRSYLGLLEDFPHLYEFTLSESATLNIKTKQAVHDNSQPVNLILLSVSPNNSGIEEIVRLNTPVSERAESRNSLTAITTLDSDWLEVDLEPGLYRLEVSTPVNLGPYELDFGIDSVKNGYLGTFRAILDVQQHFGYSKTRFIMSTYVLYQLGIIILIGGIYYTWRRQKGTVEEVKETQDVA